MQRHARQRPVVQVENHAENRCLDDDHEKSANAHRIRCERVPKWQRKRQSAVPEAGPRRPNRRLERGRKRSALLKSTVTSIIKSNHR